MQPIYGVLSAIVRALLGLASRVPMAPSIEHSGDLRGYLYFYALGSDLLNKSLIQPAQES